MKLQTITTFFLLLCYASHANAQALEPKPNTEVTLLRDAQLPTCTDTLKATATIDPQLTSTFFTQIKKSYPWHIVEHKDGTLEDTLDGIVDKEDQIKIEHTSNCMSTHQGNHLMKHCDALLKDGTTTLTIWGGFPAYTSSLKIIITPDLKAQCYFETTYPSPVSYLAWRITKKEICFKKSNLKKGEQLLGWIAVEFEEPSTVKGKTVWTTYKIEGHIKPIIKAPAPKTNEKITP